nr:hypothetical protein [Marinicella sp. W31]MDC2876582.1 hypothetical protein [Marinicella sp. W31]
MSGAAIRAASGRHQALEAATRKVCILEAAFDALPQPLALWRKDGSLDLANASFRSAYDIDGSHNAVRREALSVEGDGHAVVVRRTQSGNSSTAEVRTTHGEWMQLAEHRFENGTQLTMGTNITRFKEEQNRLQVEQERLREKVSAMATSHRKLELRCASLESALDGPAGVPSQAEKAFAGQTADHAVPAEMRTSLNAVLGFSELMIAETEKARQPGCKLDEYARHIHAGGKALHALVERLENKGEVYFASDGHDGPVVRRIVG